jgi:uncharacterized protein
MASPILRPVVVTDLLRPSGHARMVEGEVPLDLRAGESQVHATARVQATLLPSGEGVVSEIIVKVPASVACSRCLTEWDEEVEVSARRLFTRVPDEDGYAIGPDDRLDLAPWVRDEVSVSLPDDPLCRPGCLGLCSVCGADLNTAPCEGHSEQSSSPFAVLKDLFDSTS